MNHRIVAIGATPDLYQQTLAACTPGCTFDYGVNQECIAECMTLAGMKPQSSKGSMWPIAGLVAGMAVVAFLVTRKK